MTEEQKFHFDLQGYLAVPNALDREQVAELNALMDRNWGSADVAENKKYFHFRNLLTWGKPCHDLIDNPRVLPILEYLLGKNFRLDHDYAVAIQTRGGGPGLHGVGGDYFDPTSYFQYSHGKMHCGLTVVSYNLRDVSPGEGGFACVPGSHKSNYPFPKSWCGLENPVDCVKAVPGPAGNAVIFTEALWHGTLPWRSDRERRTIFFKYTPHCLQFSLDAYDSSDYEGLTERQELILRPPECRIYNSPHIKRRKPVGAAG
jgi:ectoine hydroxylase-related dioxygenase (phytanoyl-CoA dioxygenase family)